MRGIVGNEASWSWVVYRIVMLYALLILDVVVDVRWLNRSESSTETR